LNPQKIVILKMGDLSKYNSPDYDDLIIKGTGLEKTLFRVCDVISGEILPSTKEVKAVVISGSSLMITDDHKWKEPVYNWLEKIINLNLPILGICFGHQLLASVLGGEIGNNPAGLELGSYPVFLNESREYDMLLKGHSVFTAQISHVQSILKLPENSEVLAYSDKEPYQAVKFGEKIWGLQFHPEFSIDLMRKIISKKTENSCGKFDKENYLGSLKETPESSSLLKRFGEIILNRS